MKLLVVDENCGECKVVERWIKAEGLLVKLVGRGSEKLQVPIMIVPALVEEGRILAYGSDIISYLTSHMIDC